jgi:hypothetical protein
VDLYLLLGHRELEGNGRAVTVVDHQSGQRWSDDEAWNRIIHAQYLHHAVVLASQIAVADRDRELIRMTDIGVLSSTWGELFDGWPVVVVPQLWCFRDLDPAGTWVDAAQLTLTLTATGSILRLTEAALAKGSTLPRGRRWEEVSRLGWAWIVRTPVAPELTLGYPTIRTAENERYEVVGPSDIHLVPLTVDSTARASNGTS